METIKVKPWGTDQGHYVLINASDFDASVHVRVDESEAVQEAEKPAERAPRGRRSEAKQGA